MTRDTLYEKLIIVACFLCNLSQIPVLFENRLLGLAYMGCWSILAVMLLLSEKYINVNYFVLPIIFDAFCLLMYILKGGYISSSLFRAINLSTFILLVGIWGGRYFNEDRLKKVSLSFIISALIVAVYLYLNVFRGVDWANSGAYLYGSKNSAGQIFLTAVILLALLFFQEHKIVSSGAIAFFTALIIMMKSRATLLTLVIIVFYVVLFVFKKPAYKFLGLISIFSVAIIIYTNQSLYNLYINQIMLNNRDITDISAIASNRDIQYTYFIQNFWNYYMVGTGGTYIEAMPMSVLMSYGIIGGIPVLIYSLYPIFVGIKNVKYPEYRVFCIIIISLGLMMWLNGIFEEQAPFGPGVKCYFLWLVTGVFLGYKQEYELYEPEDEEELYN